MHPQKNYSSCLCNSRLSSKRVSLALLPLLELSQAEIVEDQLDVPVHIYVNYR